MLPLHEFMPMVDQRIAALRSRLEAAAPSVFPSLPSERSQFTGLAYVETVGSTLNFQFGAAEGLYTPDAIRMRDASLAAVGADRETFFSRVARQLPPDSRILNVGAGGDVALIRAFQEAGREVISTDLAEDTVQVLRTRYPAPAFACDLIYLSQVLPEPVQFIVGNSVLAYVQPDKAHAVVSNLWESMESGGVFTFDLAPSPVYFELMEAIRERTLTNSSEVDPVRLLSYVAEFGSHDGIKAAALYYQCRWFAVNMALVALLREHFESLGARCVTGRYCYDTPTGAKQLGLTLRVSRCWDAVLEPVVGEELYSNSAVILRNEAQQVNSYLVLTAVDRSSGEKLARAFGIHVDARRDAWSVMDYVADNQTIGAIPKTVSERVLVDLDVEGIKERIRPYLAGEPVVPPKPVPWHIAVDQTLHKMVRLGSHGWTIEKADYQIDQAYLQAAQRQASATVKAQKERAKKQERKREKQAKKMQRRKR